MAPSFIASVLNASMVVLAIADSTEPYEMELTSGGVASAVIASTNATKGSSSLAS